MTEPHPSAKLGRMAGQIAGYFSAYPEADAATSIATHINTFWPRKMREDFLLCFPEDDARLTPLLRSARRQIRGNGAI
jgi:formate dehydrogenase subunit delta